MTRRGDRAPPFLGRVFGHGTKRGKQGWSARRTDEEPKKAERWAALHDGTYGAAVRGLAMAQTTRITCDRDGGPCYGTNGDDLIQGSAISDFIHARGGTDGVNAARGSDFVFGGRGNDDPGGSPNGHNPAYHLEGGPGRDVVRGAPARTR